MQPSEPSHNEAMIKVFYDGSCPLCRREIEHYQGMQGADRIHWIDITERFSEMDQYGLTLENAMARFHVLDAEGRWQTGAYGFSEMWSQLPALKWASVLLKRLYLLPAADWVYSYFARWRMKKRCSEHACK